MAEQNDMFLLVGRDYRILKMLSIMAFVGEGKCSLLSSKRQFEINVDFQVPGVSYILGSIFIPSRQHAQIKHQMDYNQERAVTDRLWPRLETLDWVLNIILVLNRERVLEWNVIFHHTW
jgi:hypothetical protein